MNMLKNGVIIQGVEIEFNDKETLDVWNSMLVFFNLTKEFKLNLVSYKLDKENFKRVEMSVYREDIDKLTNFVSFKVGFDKKLIEAVFFSDNNIVATSAELFRENIQKIIENL